MSETKTYDQLTQDNVSEILYRLLSAGNIKEGEGNDQRVHSTHPTIVRGVEFQPCGITYYLDSRTSAAIPHSIESELEKLYPLNKEAFWYGIDHVLGEIEEPGTLRKLGEYGLRGIFSALDNLREKSSYHSVSEKLKQIVDNKTFQGTQAVVCCFEHEDRIQPVDVHFWAIRALGVLQEGFSSEYWMNMIITEQKYATPAFHGLAFCSLNDAHFYLNRNDLGIDKDSANVSYRAAERFFKGEK